jgi:hypothetical protein
MICYLSDIMSVHLQSKIIPDYLLFAGRDVQEAPLVGVNDMTDYLRFGNVKFNDQLVGLIQLEIFSGHQPRILRPRKKLQ